MTRESHEYYNYTSFYYAVYLTCDSSQKYLYSLYFVKNDMKLNRMDGRQNRQSIGIYTEWTEQQTKKPTDGHMLMNSHLLA